jgi:hypothetical protein
MSSVLLSSRMACSFAILHEAHLCSLTLTAVGLEDPHINQQPNYKVKRMRDVSGAVTDPRGKRTSTNAVADTRSCERRTRCEAPHTGASSS